MIAIDAPAVQEDSRPVAALGWAAFLGMSWTWCIGMFLPVLMVRDFGFWAWVVFTVPNVIGAAAMGRVLRDARQSARLTTSHAEACAAFSAVTILFQVTFVGWVGVALIGNWAGALMLGVVAITLAAGQLGRRRDWIAAAAMFAVSITAFAAAVHFGRDVPRAGFPPVNPRISKDLLYLVPVCVFGFALCPYLDLTFHRARQATSPAAGAFAFAAGFGGPFLLMLAFTLWYARLLAPIAPISPISRGQPLTIPDGLRWAIAVHLCAQCGYTIAVHWRELGWGPRLSDSIARHPRKVAGAMIGFCAALLPHVGGWLAHRFLLTNLLPAEVTYRLFMSSYGLAFPAYVWLCMIPTRAERAATQSGGVAVLGATRSKLRILAIAVIGAAPMFWKGFVANDMVWLAPGVGLVLAARLALREKRPTAL